MNYLSTRFALFLQYYVNTFTFNISAIGISKASTLADSICNVFYGNCVFKLVITLIF